MLGAFWGGLFCGWIGQKYNWHVGFGIAGFFMILGLITFIKKQQMLGPIGLPPATVDIYKKVFAGISLQNCIYIVSVLAIPVFYIIA